MHKYQDNLLIPSQINATIKMFYVDFITAMSAFFGGVIGESIANYIGLKNQWTFILIIYGAIFAVFATAHNHNAPQIRNFVVLWQLLKQDQNEYAPIFLEGGNDEQKKN